jgi:hypothetical protein
MKLLIMQFSPTSGHFISLRSRYSPQHPVLKHRQYMFLSLRQRPSFTTIQNNHRQNYSCVYSNFYVSPYVPLALKSRSVFRFPTILTVNNDHCYVVLYVVAFQWSPSILCDVGTG